MNLKNLVRIAILAVLGLALGMIGGYASVIFGPYAMYVGHAFGAIFSGTVYYIMAYKTKARFAPFTYYLIFGLIYLIMGMWPMTIINIIAGAVAEISIGKPQDYTIKRVGLSFVLSEMVSGLHGVIFIYTVGAKGMMKLFPSMFTLESAMQIEKFYKDSKTLLIVLVIYIAMASLGAFIGKNVYQKFFDKVSGSRSQLN